MFQAATGKWSTLRTMAEDITGPPQIVSDAELHRRRIKAWGAVTLLFVALVLMAAFHPFAGGSGLLGSLFLALATQQLLKAYGETAIRRILRILFLPFLTACAFAMKGQYPLSALLVFAPAALILWFLGIFLGRCWYKRGCAPSRE